MFVFARTASRQNVDLAAHLGDHFPDCRIGGGQALHLCAQIPHYGFATGPAVGATILIQEPLCLAQRPYLRLALGPQIP